MSLTAAEVIGAIIGIAGLFSAIISAAILYGRRLERTARMSKDAATTASGLEALRKAVESMQKSFHDLQLERRLLKIEMWCWNGVELEHWMRNLAQSIMGFLPEDRQKEYEECLQRIMSAAKFSVQRQKELMSIGPGPLPPDPSR